MAIIAILLGAIMSAAGAYEIYAGNSYITMEQGWSEFISGTVLLTGGLVVIAIGLAIRAVTNLQKSLAQGILATAAPREPEVATLVAPPSLDARGLEARGLDTGGFSLDPATRSDQPIIDAPATTFALDPAPGGAGSEATTIEPPAPTITSEPVAEVAPERGATVRERFRRRSGSYAGMPPALPGRVEAAAEPIAPVSTASTGDLADLEPPSLRPAPSREPQPKADEPSADDWLDRSFADLDREVAGLYSPASDKSRGRKASIQDQNANDTMFTDAVVTEARPAAVGGKDALDHDGGGRASLSGADRAANPLQAEEAPNGRDVASAPGTPAGESAVIGRYESDGTAYVMYADGSIEAQSEAGVYRFGSMAELRSFIEG